jgi:hypothetical protein
MDDELALENEFPDQYAGRKGRKEKREKSSEIGRKIIEYLERYPATIEELSKKTGVNKETVKSNLRGRLMYLGLVRKLDKGKYVAKWISDEEIRVKASYRYLKEMLRRRPASQEVAISIKETPQKSKNLLLKYIPRYAEPGSEEIRMSCLALAKIIAYGNLKSPNKKALFGHGIEHLVVDGLDLETLNEILNGIPAEKLEEARDYLKKFPGMRARMVYQDRGNKRHYTVKWSLDAIDYLHTCRPKDQSAEVPIPRRPKANLSRYWELKKLVDGRSGSYAMAEISAIAQYCVPTPKVLEDLLNWVVSAENKQDILTILKMFCRNGLEVEEINEGQKDQTCEALSKIAFEADKSIEESADRWTALEIIKMVDARKDLTGKKAKEFVKGMLGKGYQTGNYLFEAGKWLAEDSTIRLELVRIAEEILTNSRERIIVSGCHEFLKKIDSGRVSQTNRKDLGHLLDANPRSQGFPSLWKPVDDSSDL